MPEKKDIANVFLMVVLIGALYLSYLFLKPFLLVIILSGVLVSIFYGWYERLMGWLRGRKNLASLIMVILIAIIIVLPVTNFVFYLSKQSLEGFSSITVWINSGALERAVNENVVRRLNFIDPSVLNIRQYLISTSSQISSFLVSGGRSILKGTTQFITSLIVMFFTMFFLFRDGRKLMERLMYLIPLPHKYNQAIFKKFRDVSYSTIVSTFVTAIVQGIVGALGFMIIGVPAFFAGVAMAFFALLPYVGTAIIWLPTGIYLLLIGKIWQGVFLLIWGFGVIGTIDNFLRPYLIKGRAEVHPLIIFFAIFGGIITFGFWGMIIGPIVVAITFTLLHIYELEYKEVLEK